MLCATAAGATIAPWSCCDRLLLQVQSIPAELFWHPFLVLLPCSMIPIRTAVIPKFLPLCKCDMRAMYPLPTHTYLHPICFAYIHFYLAH